MFAAFIGAGSPFAVFERACPEQGRRVGIEVRGSLVGNRDAWVSSSGVIYGFHSTPTASSFTLTTSPNQIKLWRRSAVAD